MIEKLFIPSDDLTKEFLKEETKLRDKYLGSLSKEERVYAEAAIKYTEVLNGIPSFMDQKMHLGISLENAIYSLAINCERTKVSKNKRFTRSFLLSIHSSLIRVPISSKAFYQSLHDEFFNYLEKGDRKIERFDGIIKLRINKEEGIEVYDLKKKEIPLPPKRERKSIAYKFKFED